MIPLTTSFGLLTPRIHYYEHHSKPLKSASTDSGPSPIEIIIGLLALVLALAAVVVGVAQYLQARAVKSRQSDLESGRTTIEMPTRTPSHAPDIGLVRNDCR